MPAKTYTIECKYRLGQRVFQPHIKVQSKTILEYGARKLIVKGFRHDYFPAEGIDTVSYYVRKPSPLTDHLIPEDELYPTEAEAIASMEDKQ